MTWDEWNLVLHFVIGCELPCTISKRFYGQFTFDVYEPQQYPGLDAEMILRVDPWHLWIGNGARSHTPDDMKRFKSCYAIADSKRNREMLEVCEIAPPATIWDIWNYDDIKLWGRDLI